MERAFLSRTMPTMMSRAWASVLAQWTLVPRDSSLVGEFDEMLVEVVDGLPFRFGGGLARGLPVLERRLAFVAGDFVIAQGRADESGDGARSRVTRLRVACQKIYACWNCERGCIESCLSVFIRG